MVDWNEMRKIFWGLVLLFLAACAGTGKYTVNDNFYEKKLEEANLYFVRPIKFFASAGDVPISINGNKIFSLGIGEKEKYSVKPGKYTITTSFSYRTLGLDTYELTVKANNNYFFIIEPTQHLQKVKIIETSEMGFQKVEEDKLFAFERNKEREKDFENEKKIRDQIEKERLALVNKKEIEEKKIRNIERVSILEKNFGRFCNKYLKGSDQYVNCVLDQDRIAKETESKKLLVKQEQERKQLEAEQAKRKTIEDKQKEEANKLAKMSPDDRRTYTCSEKFGFRKGSDNFKECVFKIYSAEIELEKLELQKQLAKANADLAKANAASNQKLADAQTAAAIMQAYAAQQQAIAANTADSLALMESGLRMLSPQRPAARAPMNCQYHAKMLSCF